jgi:hypothetical protein
MQQNGKTLYRKDFTPGNAPCQCICPNVSDFSFQQIAKRNEHGRIPAHGL